MRAILEDIEASDFADISLVIANGLPQPEDSSSKWVKLLRMIFNRTQRRRLLFALYKKYDRPDPRLADPLEAVDCRDILGKYETCTVTPEVKGPVHRFPAEATPMLKDHGLDVILRKLHKLYRGWERVQVDTVPVAACRGRRKTCAL